MTLNKSDIVAAIKAEVVRIASSLDLDASDLLADEILPASGLIDSAGLLELISWFEQAYDFRIASEDFTIDNLGSLDLMADYLLSRKAQG
ncbi:phosphopantetheine-binding protein [Paucibacter sp. Y2R2-4]|uniref:phosphopantetheine-binding protein n=1 Tax=Paucibacter sp. Y2R2-4 TaxID=2893553 RepID=UPI0021E4D7F1|nr:phosphopantetheine-binding protein [Paucibacter sp. Y2R2-4]MCV2348556.1 phosphopantetheine-binding protein [Paucibacter sp. Y2R2-4]